MNDKRADQPIKIETMKKTAIFVFFAMLSLGVMAQSKLINSGKTSTAKKALTTPTKKRSGASNKTTKNSTYNTTAPTRRSAVSDPNATKGYMEITGMSFANTDVDNHIIDDYGETLYARDLRYLSPRVFYKGLSTQEKEIELDIRISDEYGKVEKNDRSKEGYTYSYTTTVEPGNGKTMDIGGWGNKNGTNYKEGVYKVQVAYKGNILYEKKIRINGGKRPVTNSNLMNVSSVLFRNVDKNSNVITDYSETFYEGQTQYVEPKIYYTGLTTSDKEVTLYMRLYLASGNLSTGDISPVGFTNKKKCTIEPGLNSLTLPGWGNSIGSTYKEGVHYFELWLDGEKIYETSFEVEKAPQAATYLTVDSKTSVSTTFSSSEVTETYFVKTDGDSWTVENLPSWCEVTSKTDEFFILKCKRNPGATRTATLKVKSGLKVVNVNITQK